MIARRASAAVSIGIFVAAAAATAKSAFFVFGSTSSAHRERAICQCPFTRGEGDDENVDRWAAVFFAVVYERVNMRSRLQRRGQDARARSLRFKAAVRRKRFLLSVLRS